MHFHSNKCSALAVTNKLLNFPIPFFEFIYNLNGNYLSYVDHVKDLGVNYNSRIIWRNHCKALAAKTNQTLGFVRRTCHFTTCSKQRRVLYLALVRSIFEHCSQVWAPQTAEALNVIDVVQRRAVKWICKEPFVSYSDSEFLCKQKQLDLLPMKYKFIMSDLILFHKIVHESVNIKMPNYIVNLRPSDITRPTRQTQCIANNSDTLKYRCTVIPRVDAFKQSFFVRTYSNWNNLPLSIREIVNSDSFSSSLKMHLWLLLGLKPD